MPVVFEEFSLPCSLNRLLARMLLGDILRRFGLIFSIVIAALGCLPSSASSAAEGAPPPPATKFGWTKQCDGQGPCITRRRTLTDEGKEVWVLIQTDAKEPDLIQFWVPGDANQGSGLTLYVGMDDPEPYFLTPSRCDENCVSTMLLEPEFLTRLKRGDFMVVAYNDSKGRTVDTLVDLAGITKTLSGPGISPETGRLLDAYLLWEREAFAYGPKWTTDCKDVLTSTCTVAAQIPVFQLGEARLSIGADKKGQIFAHARLPATKLYGPAVKWRIDDDGEQSADYAECGKATCLADIRIGQDGLAALVAGKMLSLEYRDHRRGARTIASFGLAGFPDLSAPAGAAEAEEAARIEEEGAVIEARADIGGAGPEDELRLTIRLGGTKVEPSATVSLPDPYEGSMRWDVDGKRMTFGLVPAGENFERNEAAFALYPADLERLRSGKTLTLEFYEHGDFNQPKQVSFDLAELLQG